MNKEKRQRLSEKKSFEISSFRKETENEFLHFIKSLLIEGIPILRYSFLSLHSTSMILHYQPYSQSLLFRKEPPPKSCIKLYFCEESTTIIQFYDIVEFYIVDRYYTFSKEKVDKMIFVTIFKERFDYYTYAMEFESSLERNTMYEGFQLLLKHFKNCYPK